MAALSRFKAREGHCRVPNTHVENGFRLGGWVTTQRANSNEIDTDRRQRLQELGFVWDPLAALWEEGFAHLSAYKAREGHCRVPNAHVENGFRLGQWVTVQRTKSDEIDTDRRRRLQKLGFVWDAHKSKWEDGFAALSRFKAREGHCRVPGEHIENGFRLGGWVSNQRANSRRNRSRPSAAFSRSWDLSGMLIKNSWEDGFAALSRFKAREGHCRVPAKHVENGFRLGGWVREQRGNSDEIDTDRRRRLQKLGFVWDPRAALWEEGFARLIAYKAREGHCRVPDKYIENGFRLGQWVGVQRVNSDEIDADRRRRLQQLDFVWDVHKNKWEDGLAALSRFKAREGHCRVPKKHIENGFRLGQWVNNWRARSDEIDTDRRRRLQELGFIWDVWRLVGGRLRTPNRLQSARGTLPCS